MQQLKHISIAILLALALASCSLPFAAGPAPTAEPTEAASAAPTPSAAPAPSAAPTAAATAAPSATLPPPSPTVAPTITPEPIDPTPTLAPLAADEREQIFLEAWELVRDNYLYSDYNGLDWQAVRAEFLPKVQATESPEAFYDLMYELVERLGDEHSRFESPQDVARQQAEFAGDLKYVGIGAVVRSIDEGGLILTLAANGPAEQAGIKTRDLILEVEGIPFNDPEAFGPQGPIGKIKGEPGTVVRLKVQTEGEQPREIDVVRQVIPSDAFPRVEGQLLDGNIGLVSIETFYVDNVDGLVREKIEELLDSGPLNGLIIDVRSNSGGYVHLMRNTLGQFIDGGSFGSTGGRTSNEEQTIPRGQLIEGMLDVPIVVLIGPDSASAAEMFAAGMQVRNRARIVGLPSAGNTENLFSYNFDDGSRLMLAEAAYRRPDGTLIEGEGVIPDRQVEADWWRFAPEDDPQIGAAIDEIAAMRDKTIQAGRP
jgi:carboxyl-terminal processing protease